MNIEPELTSSIFGRYELRIRYDGAGERVVRPHAVFRTDTGKVCVHVHEPARDGWRVLDIARMTHPDVLPSRFEPHPDYDPRATLYRHGLIVAVSDGG